jgi:hypothetical protein
MRPVSHWGRQRSLPSTGYDPYTRRTFDLAFLLNFLNLFNWIPKYSRNFNIKSIWPFVALSYMVLKWNDLFQMKDHGAQPSRGGWHRPWKGGGSCWPPCSSRCARKPTGVSTRILRFFIIIIISLFMSPLLGNRPCGLHIKTITHHAGPCITHKENGPQPTTRVQCGLVGADDCKWSRD